MVREFILIALTEALFSFSGINVCKITGKQHTFFLSNFIPLGVLLFRNLKKSRHKLAGIVITRD